MNYREACEVLGVSTEASDEEAKKKYRELTKKYHPDVNKDPSATDKFKQINEAYSTFQKKEEESFFSQDSHNSGNPFADFINSAFNINQNQQQQPVDIKIPLNITFEESILGTSQKIQYKRNIKCVPCNGSGNIPKNNPNACKECGGRGVKTVSQGHMIYTQMCSSCRGQNTLTDKCGSCNGRAAKETECTYSVEIPEGVEHGNVLRMPGAGNYFRHQMMGIEQYLDAYVIINVSPKEGFSLRNGNDVVSTVKISLLEALEGATKELPTIHGNASVKINSNIKNKDEIRLNNYGVKSKNGSHVFQVIVEYPTDTAKLIQALKKQGN
jgi:molecular chaperone DnaJ